MENEKPELNPADHDYRRTFPKVRGGWNEKKIIKQLKPMSSTRSDFLFQKEIALYDTPQEFMDNLFYHGSARGISDLKPSIVLKDMGHFGGGYEEKYYGISLSTDRNKASDFTGASNSGNVAPVLLKRDAKIKIMPEIKDSNELTDIISELWDEGIDAVVIGDHSKESSEKEVVILNPKAAVVGKPEYFQVFNKPKMPSFTENELLEMWLQSGENYKKEAEVSWERSNESYRAKFGKERNTEKWNSRQQKVYNYHKYNVEQFKKDRELSNNIEGYLKNKTKRKATIKP